MDTPTIQEEQVKVVKSGEIPIQVVLARSAKGLTLTVKVLPHVEEFFRSAAVGDPVDVKSLGRYWVSIGDQPLMTYAVTLASFQVDAFNKPVLARFDKVGKLLADPDQEIRERGDPAAINMSFLRLVGTSEGAGVTFGVKGVYTTEQVRTLRDAIAESAKRFYSMYLKPINMAVQISTQEM